MITVIETISHGGFGLVEKVVLGNGEIAARKTFSPKFEENPKELEKLKKRFAREVKTQLDLSQDHIIPIIDSDMSSNPPWYLMPLAAHSLSQQIVADKLRNTVNFEALFQILDNLEYLHRMEFVHRDLKPDNVLFHDGNWKLADFGLVLPLGDTTLTTTKSRWGTQDYMAPEQMTSFKYVTHKADIYSFGCILHDYFGNEERVPYSKHSAEGDIGYIIERCTEVQPAKRFNSIAALRSALLPVSISPMGNTITGDTKGWLSDIAEFRTWDQTKLDQFTRYLAQVSIEDDENLIMYSLDEEKFRYFAGLDPDTWSFIADRYCEWTQGSFGFSYCDTLGRRLKTIFELGNISIKSAAAIALAELGSSHNRWYVMEILTDICGPSLPSEVAQRLVIDIRALEKEPQFIRSAEGIHLTKTVYHRSISAIL